MDGQTDGRMDGWGWTDLDTNYTRTPMAGKWIRCQLTYFLYPSRIYTMLSNTLIRNMYIRFTHLLYVMNWWVDGWMEERMDGWMDGIRWDEIDGIKRRRWMDAIVDGLMDGRMDGWKGGWMERWMDGIIPKLKCRRMNYMPTSIITRWYAENNSQ